MKIQLTILLIFALFLCDFVSAESEKTSEIVGIKKFGRHGNGSKMNRPERKNVEKRSRFPRRLQHGNGGYGTTSRMAMNRPGPR